MTHDEWIIYAIDNGLVYDQRELEEWRRRQAEKNAKKVRLITRIDPQMEFFDDIEETG